MKIYDDEFSVSGSFSGLEQMRGWTDGEVITEHGIVSAYAQGGDEHAPLTRLNFAYKGRHYIRTFDGKRYSYRGIALKAKQFAAECVAKQETKQ